MVILYSFETVFQFCCVSLFLSFYALPLSRPIRFIVDLLDPVLFRLSLSPLWVAVTVSDYDSFVFLFLCLSRPFSPKKTTTKKRR